MDFTLPSSAVITTARLYHDDDRATAYTEVPAERTDTGGTLFTDGHIGRFWPVVTYTVGAQTFTLDLPHVDLPVDLSLVVSPETVADEAGIDLPLDPRDRAIVETAIRNAQADVRAYLGRPLTPQTYTERDLYPHPAGWALTSAPDEDVIRYVSVDAQYRLDGVTPDGLFTITYVAGIDARDDPDLHPIRRFVIAHAMNSQPFLKMYQKVTGAKGEIRSVTAEGQSVSRYQVSLGGGTGKPGEAGTPPTLGSLDYWRLAGRRVHVAQTRGGDQWPYYSGGVVL